MSEIAYVDPEKLRGFAGDLQSILGDYHRAMEMLERQLARLSATWRDDQFDTFAREVRTTRVILHEFIEEGTKARLVMLEDASLAEAAQKIQE
jgi:uncharacterized protein YukE